MTEFRHIPPEGQSLFPQHINAADCICNPTRTSVYKRTFAARKGTTRTLVRIDWQHHLIQPTEDSEQLLVLVPSEASFAAREDAFLAGLLR